MIGYIGNGSAVQKLESGAKFAKFSFTTNESYKNQEGEWQEQTEWHKFLCWRGLAEKSKESPKKGILVHIEGKLTHRKYKDKEGSERYVTEVVATILQLLQHQKGGNSGGYVPTEEDATPTNTIEENVPATPPAEK